MKKPKVIALVVTLLPLVVEGVEPVKFDITGMKVGDRLTEKFAYSRCPGKDEGKPDIQCHEFIKIESGEILILYQFDDFKLVGVSLSFESDLFNDVVKAYTSKFGVSPHKTYQEPVVTRAGVKYTNEVVSWNTDSGEFVVEKYGGRVDKGHAQLRSPAWVRYIEKKKEAQQKELGGKL
jgi:hypothetical protein